MPQIEFRENKVLKLANVLSRKVPSSISKIKGEKFYEKNRNYGRNYASSLNPQQ